MVAKGTAKENFKYCTKDESRVGGPYTFGMFPDVGQGERKDIHALRDAALTGRSFIDCASDDTLLPTLARSMRFFERMEADSKARFTDRTPPYTIFHYGPAGTGKTHCACAGIEPADLFMFDGGFWDGYTGQSNVVLDEFGGHTLPPLALNRLLDKYPYTLNIKGRSAPCRAEHIHITANYLPNTWWSDKTRFNWEALARRIQECHHHHHYKQFTRYVSDEAGTAIDKMIAATNVDMSAQNQ